MSIDTWITLGYYASSLGFLLASYVTFDAVRKSKPSGLRTVLTYLFIGTATFFVVTIFQKLGADFFGIADESVDIWWHLMFYLAMISFYLGFKTLAGLGNTEQSMSGAQGGAAKIWGIIVAILLVAFFIIPSSVDSLVQAYTASRLGELGAHHFIAFVMAGIVGAYVFSAKLFLGQIGRAIAAPMIIAVWALSLQHLWELLNESWKVVDVTPATGEGVEKIFLCIAAACIIAAALRLKAFAK